MISRGCLWTLLICRIGARGSVFCVSIGAGEAFLGVLLKWLFDMPSYTLVEIFPPLFCEELLCGMSGVAFLDGLKEVS
jgi:hypothetical protein